MIDADLIQRINELARKKKEIGLTPQEKKEQEKLRQVYLEAIRGQVKQQLSRIHFTNKQ